MLRVTPDGSAAIDRPIAEERPVAVEVNGLGYAVMMMTPADLDRFAVGFLLTERLADCADDVLDHDVVHTAHGIILRVTLAERCADRIADRVRHRSSDTGCGLCGIASLEQVVRPAPAAPPAMIERGAVFAAIAGLRDRQPMNARTGAHHAAAFCDARGAILRAFEDVGRHNALDKLIGWMAGAGIDPAAGFIVVSSRVSFEMVDKALISGSAMLVGISAATDLAVRHAQAHGLTLVALARPDAFLVPSDPGGCFA